MNNGIAPSLDFSAFNNLNIKFNEKIGLAASWINTFVGLYFRINLRHFFARSALVRPPFTNFILLFYRFFMNFLCDLLTAITIFENYFDKIALFIECLISISPLY